MLVVDSLASAPRWMRPPTWRWTAAMKIASQCSELPTMKMLEQMGYPRDSYLYKAARYYTMYHRPSLGGARTARVRYPDIYRSTLIFKGRNHFSFWKTALEALFLTTLSLRDIARKMGIGQDIELLKTYRAVFFDVDPKKDSEASIQLNVIATCCQGDSLEPTDEYISKLTAYTKGFQTYYRLFISRDADLLSDEDSTWIENLIKSKLGKKALALASSKRTEYISEHLDILKTSKDWLGSEEVDTDALGRKAKSKALTKLLSTVHSVCDEAAEASEELTAEYEDYIDVGWGEDAGQQVDTGDNQN